MLFNLSFFLLLFTVSPPVFSFGRGFSAVMTVSPEESRLDLLNAESVMAQIDAAQIDLLFDRQTLRKLQNLHVPDEVRNCRKTHQISSALPSCPTGPSCLATPSSFEVRGPGAESSAALPFPAHPGAFRLSLSLSLSLVSLFFLFFSLSTFPYPSVFLR